MQVHERNPHCWVFPLTVGHIHHNPLVYCLMTSRHFSARLPSTCILSTTFPFPCTHLPSLVYGYISKLLHLISYPRACIIPFFFLLSGTLIQLQYLNINGYQRVRSRIPPNRMETPLPAPPPHSSPLKISLSSKHFLLSSLLFHSFANTRSLL